MKCHVRQVKLNLSKKCVYYGKGLTAHAMGVFPNMRLTRAQILCDVLCVMSHGHTKQLLRSCSRSHHTTPHSSLN